MPQLRPIPLPCVTLAAVALLGGCVSPEPGENNRVLMAQSDWRIAACSDEYSNHYVQDVHSSVQACLAAGATQDEIIRAVSRVAARFGIGDWESRAESFAAIGSAYKLAGQSAGELAALAEKLTAGSAEKSQTMLRAYREETDPSNT